MNAAHFHLVVNHLPIIFPMVGVLVLIVGLAFKSQAVKRTAYIIFVVGALTSVVAMNSGENAEEFVEKTPGFDEVYIERHEESAELFAALSYVLAGLSLIALWTDVKNIKGSNVAGFVVLGASLIAIYFAKDAGTTGGEIRHTEIRSGANVFQDNHDDDHYDDH